ncbi:MAG: cupredoxin domain-containing protein [Chloroflexi bacterium]|nr:cupredoxin domain-containing protein [Chloroflexota bacterium]
MKAWIAPVLLGVLLIGAAVYVFGSQGRAAGPQTATAPAREFVAGLKRDPGTWKEVTLKVGTSSAELGQPDVTIDLDVLRPVFVPPQITVKQGQVVRLRLNGKDSGLADMPELKEAVGLEEFSGHGFQILGPYDVWVTGIRKGVTKEVTFKATEAGEFPFECVVFCSPLHYAMQGKLIVAPR